MMRLLEALLDGEVGDRRRRSSPLWPSSGNRASEVGRAGRSRRRAAVVDQVSAAISPVLRRRCWYSGRISAAWTMAAVEAGLARLVQEDAVEHVRGRRA